MGNRPKHGLVKLCGEFFARLRPENNEFGDTSTLTDPAVVDDLVDNRQTADQAINGVGGL